MVKKILKIISFTLVGIIAFALILSFVLWAVIPVYNFPEEQKFSGDKFYNPYKDYDFMVIQGLQVVLQMVRITL